MALNVITPKSDALKEKQEAAVFDYYRTGNGSNNVSEWTNNACAYSLEKILTNSVGYGDLEEKISAVSLKNLAFVLVVSWCR